MDHSSAAHLDTEARARRIAARLRRARTPLALAAVFVGLVVIVIPVWIGVPSLSIAGVLIVGALAASIHAKGHPLLLHLVSFGALAAVAYAVFGLGLSSVLTVYVPPLILLASAQILGTRAALFWAVPSLILLAAAVLFPPEVQRDVSPAVALTVRTATLVTILAFGISFRRGHDRQAAELERRATTDPLTGLANRGELDRALKETLERSARFERSGALVFLDLDGLKSINDRLGHAAGDELILHTARRIESITRAIDVPARVGGDEFVVLVSEFEDPKGPEILARKLLAAIREPLAVGDETLSPSASIGIAIFPDSATRPDELMRLADHAMYDAKRAGGGRIRLHDGAGAPVSI